MAHDIAKLHALVSKGLSGWQFDQLCFTHYPEVHQQFAPNQDRSRQVTLLIDHVTRTEGEDELVDLVEGFARKPAQRYRTETNTAAVPVAGPALQPQGTAEPQRCDILLLSANVQSMALLKLEEEAAFIQKRLEEGAGRQAVRVECRQAAQIDDLNRYLLECDPRIVHFSGHGNENGEIILLDGAGRAFPVSADTLAETFRVLSGRVECVVLSACFSAERADALAQVVRCVVGMTGEIDDESAIKFAGGFYRALAFGRDYPSAVEQGRLEIRQLLLPDAQIPRFFTRDWQLHDPAKARWGGPTRVTRQAATDEGDQAPVMKMWFGTNRRPCDPQDPSRGYGSERADRVHYGTCEVTVPKSHRIGKLSSPAWWRWITRVDDRVRLDLESIRPLAAEAFEKQLALRLQEIKADERDVLVYLHGYNMSFDDAARRAAQISADIRFPGATAFFSWPSLRKLVGYAADVETIRYSERFLVEFFQQVFRIAPPEKVHIIAHSMGNRGLLHALPAILNGIERRRPLGQVILAAPDVDADIFRSCAEVYTTAALQTTLYASRKDWAVWLSSIVNWGERAGLHPPVTTVPGIDTIRVINTDLESLGHGYVADAREVLTDVQEAIMFGASPHKRIGLSQRNSDDGSVYWEFLR